MGNHSRRQDQKTLSVGVTYKEGLFRREIENSGEERASVKSLGGNSQGRVIKVRGI